VKTPRAALVLAAVLVGACASVPPTPSVSTGLASPSPGSTNTPTISAAPLQPQPPTSQTLIGAALREGHIDYGTSLLYRAYALFGDPRLPAEYHGGGATEDLGLFDEAADPLQPVSADLRDQLAPFLVRPTDPRSVFNAPPPTASVTLAAFGSAGSGPGREAPHAAPLCDAQGWLSQTSQAHPVKVWAKCGENAGLAASFVLDALGMMDELWAIETALMGQPIADTKDNDPSPASPTIDVYLVFVLGCGSRRAPGCRDVYPGTPAWTASADPYVGKRGSRKSSAYIEIHEGILDDPDAFRTDLAHEFFHVLQRAHNSDIQFDADRNEYWFTEASATWAESAFLPDLAPRYTYKWFASFQHPEPYGVEPDIKLHTSVQSKDPLHFHEYASFVWPYFMRQELDDQGEAIAQIWRNVEGKTTFKQFTEEIDSQLTFKEHFRDFAVRNLDQKFKPSGDQPIKTYQDFDKMFPLDLPRFQPYDGEDASVGTECAGLVSPNCLVLKAAGPGDAQPIEFNQVPLGPLLAHYYHFQPDGAAKPDAPKVGQLVFDFSRLGPVDDLDIDFVVGIRDSESPGEVKWERRKVDKKNEPYRFCRTLKKDLVDQIYLVLSNHQKNERADPITGAFTVQPLTQPCLFGDLTIHHDDTSTFDDYSVHQEYTLNLHVDIRFENDQWVSNGGSWDLSGSGWTGPVGYPCHVPPRQEQHTLSGRGTWLLPGQAGTGAEGEGLLTFTILDHVPNLDILVWAHQTYADSCTSGGTDLIGFAWSGSHPSCLLQEYAAVSCTKAGTGPSPVGPDDTGPYDLTGSVTITTNASTSVTVTKDSVTGVLGASPPANP
jgi:hypothetical protein